MRPTHLIRQHTTFRMSSSRWDRAIYPVSSHPVPNCRAFHRMTGDPGRGRDSPGSQARARISGIRRWPAQSMDAPRVFKYGQVGKVPRRVGLSGDTTVRLARPGGKQRKLKEVKGPALHSPSQRLTHFPRPPGRCVCSWPAWNSEGGARH